MKAGSMKGGRGGRRKGPARIGEVRVWGDGEKMRKTQGGKWEAVKEGAKKQIKQTAKARSDWHERAMKNPVGIFSKTQPLGKMGAKMRAMEEKLRPESKGIKVGQIRKKGEPLKQLAAGSPSSKKAAAPKPKMDKATQKKQPFDQTVDHSALRSEFGVKKSRKDGGFSGSKLPAGNYGAKLREHGFLPDKKASSDTQQVWRHGDGSTFLLNPRLADGKSSFALIPPRTQGKVKPDAASKPKPKQSESQKKQPFDVKEPVDKAKRKAEWQRVDRMHRKKARAEIAAGTAERTAEIQALMKKGKTRMEAADELDRQYREKMRAGR